MAPACQNYLVISIGPLTLGFIVSHKALSQRLHRRYNSFINKKKKPAIIFDCTTVNKNPGHRERVVINVNQAGLITVLRRDFKADWCGSSGTLFLRPSVYAFDAFLRVVISYELLMRYNGMLVHASGIINDNKALLFAGPSGTGKTTIARLAQKKYRILNDEICVLWIAKKKVYAGATPFWGAMGSRPAIAERFICHRLLFPVQHSICLMEKLSNQQALQKLLRCCCLYDTGQAAAQQALCLAMELLKRLGGAWELKFTKDKRLLNLVCRAG